MARGRTHEGAGRGSDCSDDIVGAAGGLTMRGHSLRDLLTGNRGVRAGCAVALVCGVLVSLAFDPVGFPYAAIVGVAGLFVLAHRLTGMSWRRLAFVGYCFGLGFLAPLLWWMNAVSHGAYGAIVLAEAAFFAPVLVGLRLVARLWWWPAAMPMVWLLGESVRSRVPFSGFPWGRLAYVTIDTPLAAFVRLLGMPATSAIVAALAAGLAWFLVRRGGRMWLVAATMVAVFGVGWLLPTGLVGGQAGRVAEIALVQGNTPGEFLTWKPGDIFALHAAQTDQLVKRVGDGDEPQPDLVLWPENATDVDPLRDQAQGDRITALSRALGVPILVGGIFDGPTVATAYNAAVVWNAAGPAARYVKRKVVAYGEYVPGRRVIGRFAPKFDRLIPRDMLPGDQPNVLQAGAVAVGAAICWDIAFDGLAREAVVGGAQVLVVQTSNASFTGTSQPEQQFKISRLRAVETGRWVLVPSTNGISGIVNARGDVVARAPARASALLSAAVPLAHGRTPAVTLGPWIEAALVAGGIAGCGMALRRRGTGLVPSVGNSRTS